MSTTCSCIHEWYYCFFWGGGINSIYIADFVKILWRIKLIKRKRQPTVCCVFSIFLFLASVWSHRQHAANRSGSRRGTSCFGVYWRPPVAELNHGPSGCTLVFFLKKEKDYDSVQPWPVCLLFCKSKAGGHYMCWVTAQFARRTASIFMIRGIRGWHQHSRCLLLLLHVSIHASIYILTGGIGQNYNFPPNLIDSGYDLMHSTDSFDEWHWEGEYWYLLLILFFFSSPGWSQRARM